MSATQNITEMTQTGIYQVVRAIYWCLLVTFPQTLKTDVKWTPEWISIPFRNIF